MRTMSTFLVLLCVLLSSVAFAQPTISGVNAFWWLGPGILSDGGYYAQAAWTANPNGATGTPTWYIITEGGGGSVSLSCYTCASTVATSTSPSDGCAYDVTVYVTYPDGSMSSDFYVAIVTPTTTTLQAGYPSDGSWYGSYGYISTYDWQITDSCGYPDSGLDANEVFGGWYVTYSGTNWTYPTAGAAHLDTSYIYDEIGATYQSVPPSMDPQSPLSGEEVYYDYPWKLFVGTQTFGSGVVIRADTQAFYVDHGRHQ